MDDSTDRIYYFSGSPFSYLASLSVVSCKLFFVGEDLGDILVSQFREESQLQKSTTGQTSLSAWGFTLKLRSHKTTRQAHTNWHGQVQAIKKGFYSNSERGKPDWRIMESRVPTRISLGLGTGMVIV